MKPKRIWPSPDHEKRKKFLQACKEARSIAEASRIVGISRQRGHQLAKLMGIERGLQGSF